MLSLDAELLEKTEKKLKSLNIPFSENLDGDIIKGIVEKVPNLRKFQTLFEKNSEAEIKKYMIGSRSQFQKIF